jgi:hypothetical protein
MQQAGCRLSQVQALWPCMAPMHDALLCCMQLVVQWPMSSFAPAVFHARCVRSFVCRGAAAFGTHVCCADCSNKRVAASTVDSLAHYVPWQCRGPSVLGPRVGPARQDQRALRPY